MNRPSTLTVRAVRSLLVGATAVGGSFAAVGFTDRFVGGALAVVALNLLPSAVFRFGIQWLQDLARPLLVASMTLVSVGAFATAVAVSDHATAEQPAVVRGFVAFVSLTALAAVMTGSLASAIGAGIAGALASVLSGIDVADDASGVRRRLLQSTAILAGTLGLGGLRVFKRDEASSAVRRGQDSGDRLDDDRISHLLEIAEEQSFDFPEIDHLVSDEFYQVDINVTSPPSIGRDAWSLRIRGDVDREMDVDYDDLTARETEHRFVTLRCVSDYPNGYKLDTALWTGTPLRPILDAAGVGEECCVLLEAEDGYYQAFPRETLESGFLAWGMNGRPLPENHGAPVRVLIPGHWGEINVKWLSDIEIRDEPATGYWEKRGWHGTGPVETVAKFHARRRDGDHVTIGGHAYAGVRGISRVEISIDGGETWTTAQLSDPLPAATPAGGSIDPDSRANDAWRMWRHEYEHPERHEVTVRACERDGTLQSKAESNPYPNGATGWVTHAMFGKEE